MRDSHSHSTARRAGAAAALAALLLACAAVIGLTPGGPAIAQSPRPRGNTPLLRAVDILTQEALQAKKDLRIAASIADFAQRFDESIPEADLLNALTRRVHGDAFVDGYVRWQLTSFAPALPELDDRQFSKLMGNAPALLENPRADAEAIAIFQRAHDAARLSPRDLERLRESWQTIRERSEIIERLNGPAIEWRRWVDGQLSPRGPRKVQWLIERCASTINAGWLPRDAKGDITRACRDYGRSTGELALAPPHKQLIADQMMLVQGLRRRIIEEVTFLAHDRVNVSFANAYVEDHDVKRWVALLNGEEPSR